MTSSAPERFHRSVNVISSSSKRNNQLQDAQIAKISHLIEVGDIESGKGINQMQKLQRPGDTSVGLVSKAITIFGMYLTRLCMVLLGCLHHSNLTG
uniref:Uncharacterized protein n=1 Tax=Lactuca sativa TaxID=4236 RepID=A0A9R1UZP6_LACSA|nr:hypothetical protein LSAT_V11C700388160 [Lactuca sativa]